MCWSVILNTMALSCRYKITVQQVDVKRKMLPVCITLAILCNLSKISNKKNIHLLLAHN